jgi:hypothetical protein
MTVLYQQQMQLFPTNNQQQPSAPTPQRQQQPSNECDFDDFEGEEDEEFQQQQMNIQQMQYTQRQQQKQQQHGVVQAAPSPSPSLSRSERPEQAHVVAQQTSAQSFPQQPLQNVAQYSSSNRGTPIKISTSIRPISHTGIAQVSIFPRFTRLIFRISDVCD